MGHRDDWLTETVMALLGAAVSKDYQAVSDLTVEIADKRDAEGVWGLCCALAQMVTTYGLQTERGQGFTVMQVRGPLGTPISPEDAPPKDRPVVWATRFVAAYTNGDSDTAMALFEASMADPDQHVAGIAALIRLAGDVLRSAVDDRKSP